jgi:hypothetical protein
MNTFTKRRVIGLLTRGQKQLESALSSLALADREFDDEGIKHILATVRATHHKLALRIGGMQKDLRRQSER